MPVLEAVGSRRWRAAVAVAAAIAVVPVVLAYASHLGGVSSVELGSEASVVAPCDSNGVNVDYLLTYSPAKAGYVVNFVTVFGMDAACVGDKVRVTLANGPTGVGAGMATVLVGGFANVTIAAAPLAENVTRVHVLITG